jgi:large subunit ribosomal protein L24
MAAKIKKGDKVLVLTGRDKGKTGEVLQVIPDESRALVQGINLVRRHTKQTASQDAGIFSKPAPIHLSNLSLIDPKSEAGKPKPTRVGFKIENNTKVRVYKSTGEAIDG